MLLPTGLTCVTWRLLCSLLKERRLVQCRRHLPSLWQTRNGCTDWILYCDYALLCTDQLIPGCQSECERICVGSAGKLHKGLWSRWLWIRPIWYHGDLISNLCVVSMTRVIPQSADASTQMSKSTWVQISRCWKLFGMDRRSRHKPASVMAAWEAWIVMKRLSEQKLARNACNDGRAARAWGKILEMWLRLPINFSVL